MLYKPNTNLANNSLIIRTETQSLCVSRVSAAVLDAKRSDNSRRLEPLHDTVEAYNPDV